MLIFSKPSITVMMFLCGAAVCFPPVLLPPLTRSPRSYRGANFRIFNGDGKSCAYAPKTATLSPFGTPDAHRQYMNNRTLYT